MPSQSGIIRVISNAELVQEEQAMAEQELEAAREINDSPPLEGLAKFVMDRWDDARDAKNAVLPRLQTAYRTRKGLYAEDKLADIREFGGSALYLRVISNKCRVLAAWLKDVYIGQTEKPWSLSPTPKPEFPPDVEDQVRKQLSSEMAAVFAITGEPPPEEAVRGAWTEMQDRAEERLRDAARKTTQRMEKRMSDQLSEGGFSAAMADFINDVVTYPSAILRGPILRMRKRINWVRNETGGFEPEIIEEIVPEFERVDPFKIYPAAGAATPQEGYIIEHMVLSYDELYEMLGMPGVNEEMLRAALTEAREGRLQDWLNVEAKESHQDEDSPPISLKREVFNIDVLQFYGPIKGFDLLEWGIEDEIDDPDAAYEAAVWMVGPWVVKAHLNYDPLGMRPYFKASYEDVPGEFWGEGLPDVLEDVGNVVNAAGRALVNNMAIASGPQVMVNVDRIPEARNITTLFPWKIWPAEESQFGSSAPPIDFFQPNSNVNDLLTVIEKFYQLADDFSLVPRYMSGSDRVAGAGRTASGLSMLMDAANKGLKGVVANIDQWVIKPLLEKLYNHNMLYDPDDTIKGDAQIQARGAVSLMQRESLQLRRNEFLQAITNPYDAQIVGIPGRAEILREIATGLEMDVTRIVPPRDQLASMQPPDPNAGAAPSSGSPQKSNTSQEQLANGAAVTDNFSQNALTPQ